MVKMKIGSSQQSALGRDLSVRFRVSIIRNTHRALIGAPHFPSDHLRGGSGSPLIRLSRRQPMESMYELNRAARSTARMAFSAATEPMLTIDKHTQKTKDTSTAFSGMDQRGYILVARSVPLAFISRGHEGMVHSHVE